MKVIPEVVETVCERRGVFFGNLLVFNVVIINDKNFMSEVNTCLFA